MNKSLTLLLILQTLVLTLYAQQIADTTYMPALPNPAYSQGRGSVVFIDEGHFNFHTKEGRYKSFASLLERDGYVVKEYAGVFSKESLEKGKILVISNALNEMNEHNWFLPTPSAFTPDEIKVVKRWVQSGGSLFLIADHMPLAGAAAELAAAFQFEFTNGFVLDTLQNGPAIFKRHDGTLADNKITNGNRTGDRVEEVATFTGQGFKIPNDATPILTFSNRYVNFLPDTAWVFDNHTQRLPAEGLTQGAFKKYGKGRLVVFGEAAMFSAQLAGPERRKMGMNADVASQNYKLLLNIIHWLDGQYD